MEEKFLNLALKFWNQALKIGGIATVGAFVFWDLIKTLLDAIKNIFSKLPPELTFRVIVLILILAFLALVVLVIAHLFRRPPKSNGVKTDESIFTGNLNNITPLDLFTFLEKKSNSLEYPPTWYEYLNDDDKYTFVAQIKNQKNSNDSLYIPRIVPVWRSSLPTNEFQNKLEAVNSYKDIHELLKEAKNDYGANFQWEGYKSPLHYNEYPKENELKIIQGRSVDIVRM